MRIAVYAENAEVRHGISRQTEDALLRRGILPEMTLFPMLGELLAAAGGSAAFDLVMVGEAQGVHTLKSLCRLAPVIIIGDKDEGPAAFDVGADYFIENPVNGSELNRALTRCLSGKKKEYTI